MPGLVPPIDDERELLLAYVDQQRDGLRNAAYGLTDDQARATPSVSALSIATLLKHVVQTERMWIGLVQRLDSRDESAYLDGFTVPAGVTLADLVADLDACKAETADAIRARDLDDPVPIPPGVPWFPADVDAWSVRWVLLHLVEEIGRHAGHADIVRESIDGATMHPLMAAVEGWPATPWLQPWQPPTS